MIDSVQCRPNKTGCPLRGRHTAHEQVNERVRALRPRPVKLDVICLGQLAGSDIADNTDNFGRQPIAVVGAEEDLSAQWILIRKKLVSSGFAQNHNQWFVDAVPLSELTTR